MATTDNGSLPCCSRLKHPEPNRAARCAQIARCRRQSRRLCPVACRVCKVCPDHPAFGFYVNLTKLVSAAASKVVHVNASLPMDPLPIVSVLLQYYKSASRIPMLARWRRCPGVELLVNVDSRDEMDMRWLQTAADDIIFSRNVHWRHHRQRTARCANPAWTLEHKEAQVVII